MEIEKYELLQDIPCYKKWQIFQTWFILNWEITNINYLYATTNTEPTTIFDVSTRNDMCIYDIEDFDKWFKKI